ncbi:hypothetical protein M514_28104 [Trichuris suis]|uniref:Brinker DNA-binding domain-containing protein n=1 Tax=Trichuris suis TaxID=68888 RepID=A0A085MR75_9BILA|nr:hypothetical protein M514_28104 [Trichuris suis]
MTRRSYTAGFKLQVIKMAKETNNSEGASKYGVTRKMVIDWKNQEALKTLPKKQCSRRSGSARWPELENDLAEWACHNLRRDFVLASIGNIDETPIFFDMVGNRTVERKGKKSVLEKSIGHEKGHFAVALS